MFARGSGGVAGTFLAGKELTGLLRPTSGSSDNTPRFVDSFFAQFEHVREFLGGIIRVRYHTVYSFNLFKHNKLCAWRHNPPPLQVHNIFVFIRHKCKKNCSLSTSYNGEITHRKRQK